MDTEYRVLTTYKIDTGEARSSVGGFAIVLDHMMNLAREAKNVISEMASKIIELSASAESGRIAMAGLINASGFSSDFGQGLDMASTLMGKMREDAAALSGTYEQMREIFQAMIPVIHEAGRSLMQGEKMAGRVMEFGNTFGIPAEFIGREFRQMMEGRASIRNALFKDIAGYLGGMDAATFNNLDMAKKWELVNQALDKFNPMFHAVGDTFRAQETTAESYLNQLLRIGGGAMFDGLKESLHTINDYYRAHQQEIDTIAKKLGEDIAVRLRQAFEAVKDVIQFVIAHRDAIIQIAEAFAVFKGFQMLGAGGGFGAGGQNAPMGSVLGGALFGDLLAHLTGATDLFTKGMMTAEGALSQLPGIIGLIGKSALALHAAFNWVMDQIDQGRKKDIELKGDLGDPMGLLKRYGSGPLTKEGGENVAGFLMAHKLNNHFSGGVNEQHLISYLALATQQGEIGVEDSRRFLEMARSASRAGFIHGHGGGGPLAPVGDRTVMESPEDRINAALNKTGRPVQQHITNIGAINMHNNIYDSEDPARVVTHLANKLRDQIEHPAKSPSSPGLR